LQRQIYVCNKIIEAIEGNIIVAVFEVSVPKPAWLDIEITPVHLRPRMGLLTVPVLLSLSR